jgi:hypothetical protein
MIGINLQAIGSRDYNMASSRQKSYALEAFDTLPYVGPNQLSDIANCSRM